MFSSYIFSFLFLFSFFHLFSCRSHIVNMYYGNWQYYNEYKVCRINGDKMDKLFYNFMITSTGTCDFANRDIDLNFAGPVDGLCNGAIQPTTDPLKGNMYQFLQLKKRFPKLKIIASIVGNVEMHAAMLSDTGRANFVKGCVDLVQEYPSVFDGIDLDLEYPCLPTDSYCGGITPSADDKGAFVKMVQLFRTKLGTSSFISVSMNLDFIKNDAFDFALLKPLVDEYHMMTYNIADGAWNAYSGHHTQPYSNPNDPIAWRKDLTTYSAVLYMINKKIISPSKIFIGACFYGRGFRIAPEPYTSPFVPSYGATGLGTYGSETPNIFYYWDIKANYLTTATYHYDTDAQAPFIYDGTKGIYISYDDARSIQAKVDIVHKLGLAGIFGWELGMDRSGDLVDAVNLDPTCIAATNCRIASVDIPGGLALSQTPQFVVLGFDNSVLASDFKNVQQFDFLIKNANIKDALGCTPKVTAYLGGKYGDYNMVNYASRMGSVAFEGYTQTTNVDTTAATWELELKTLANDFNFLAQATAVGSRAPYFQPNDAYFQQLLTMGIKYDSSMIVNSISRVNKKSYWPFTLDYPEAIDPTLCNFLGKCPTKPFRTLWEFPVTNFDDTDQYNFVDFQVDATNYDAMLSKFKQNFIDTYTSNKAPRGLYLRWNYFSKTWFDEVNTIKSKFVVEFLTWMTDTYADIIFATESQVIDWVKNPKTFPGILTTWPSTCPDITLTPETSCANGIQKQCLFNGGNDRIQICGSMCPSLKPDLNVAWSLVADTTGASVNAFQNHWPGSVRLDLKPSDSWGTGFCASVYMTSTLSTKNAAAFVFTTSACKKIGSFSAYWGYPGIKVDLPPNQAGFRTIGKWLDVKQGVENYLGGFCMNINDPKYADAKYIKFGLDFYDENLNCEVETCGIFCGDLTCAAASGENAGNCDVDCNQFNCDSI